MPSNEATGDNWRIRPVKKDRTMTAPVLQIRNKNGGSWTVRAEFPDGSSEEISGFATENDANEWIAKELQSWLDRRQE
jgi:hypothetical protein